MFLVVQQMYGSFKGCVWEYVQGNRILGHWSGKQELPTQRFFSRKICKDLKAERIVFLTL